MSTPFIAEAVKLRIIQKNLENSYELLQERILQLDPFLGCIVKKLSDDRNKENNVVQNDILNILEPLNCIKLNMADLKVLDLAELKAEMVSIQNKLNKIKFRIKSKMDCLKEQGSMLEDEIGDYEQRICEWSQAIPVISEVMVKPKYQDHKGDQLGEEVREFIKFVSESKGHENGWSIDDHNMFLKLRSKYNDVNEMAESLHDIFPDIGVQDIIAHNVWYTKYLTLKSQQKEAIKGWRLKKMESHSPKATTQNVHPRKKKAMSPRDDKKIKAKLAAWKEEQEEKANLEGQLKKLLEVKHKNDEKIRKLKNDEAKQQVQKWKLERIAVLEVMKKKRIADKERDKEIKALHANSSIKRYQSQDKKFIERKQKNMSTNKTAQKQKVQVKSLKVHAVRDTSRLYQPTMQWNSRIKPQNQSENNYVCDIKLVSKLGQPNWRRNI